MRGDESLVSWHAVKKRLLNLAYFWPYFLEIKSSTSKSQQHLSAILVTQCWKPSEYLICAVKKSLLNKIVYWKKFLTQISWIRVFNFWVSTTSKCHSGCFMLKSQWVYLRWVCRSVRGAVHGGGRPPRAAEDRTVHSPCPQPGRSLQEDQVLQERNTADVQEFQAGEWNEWVLFERL